MPRNSRPARGVEAVRPAPATPGAVQAREARHDLRAELLSSSRELRRHVAPSVARAQRRDASNRLTLETMRTAVSGGEIVKGLSLRTKRMPRCDGNTRS